MRRQGRDPRTVAHAHRDANPDDIPTGIGPRLRARRVMGPGSEVDYSALRARVTAKRTHPKEGCLAQQLLHRRVLEVVSPCAAHTASTREMCSLFDSAAQVTRHTSTTRCVECWPTCYAAAFGARRHNWKVGRVARLSHTRVVTAPAASRSQRGDQSTLHIRVYGAAQQSNTAMGGVSAAHNRGPAPIRAPHTPIPQHASPQGWFSSHLAEARYGEPASTE